MDLLQIHGVAMGCSIAALTWGLACTMDNPAFDAYPVADDETRGEDSKGEEETGSGSATGDGDGDTTTGDGDGDTTTDTGDGDGDGDTGDGDGDPSGDGDGDIPIDICDGLDFNTCARTPGCAPLGYAELEYFDQMFCVHSSVYLGCISAEDCVPPPNNGEGYPIYCNEQLQKWVGIGGCVPPGVIENFNLEYCETLFEPPPLCP